VTVRSSRHALRSTSFATGCPTLFADFVAAMAEPDFSGSCIIGFKNELQ
jgi:hypothetical protein